MRAITVAYTLRNGIKGTMPCLARCTADAITMALDAFGTTLRTCSARVVP